MTSHTNHEKQNEQNPKQTEKPPYTSTQKNHKKSSDKKIEINSENKIEKSRDQGTVSQIFKCSQTPRNQPKCTSHDSKTLVAKNTCNIYQLFLFFPFNFNNQSKCCGKPMKFVIMSGSNHFELFLIQRKTKKSLFFE